MIVSEVPGTTRDSVDVRFERDGHPFLIIDTAGVRKKAKITRDDLEFYAYHRAQRSVRRADVVFMLIDATVEMGDGAAVFSDAFSDYGVHLYRIAY